jgi:cytoskeleton protein RodZ
MDIGGELRRARQARQLSLDDIARQTKISATILRHLENNAFDRVPRGIFTRGFLRTYAAEIGLDGDALVAQYRADHESVAARIDAAHVTAGGDSLALELAVDEAPDVEELSAGSAHARALEFGIIVIIVLGYFAWLRPSRPVQPVIAAAAAAPVTLRAAAPDTPSPVATTGHADGLTLELAPQGPCWIEATADDRRVVSRLMNAGEHETIGAHSGVTLRVGDPAVFAYSINGVAGRALGPGGHAVTVQLTPDNYARFLDARR